MPRATSLFREPPRLSQPPCVAPVCLRPTARSAYDELIVINSVDDIAPCIERLAVSGKTVGRRWTLGQIAEHLALTIDWTVAGVSPGDQPTDVIPVAFQYLARELIFRTGWIPPNMPIGSHLTPPPCMNLDAGIAHLRIAIVALQAAPEPMPTNPFFGAMPKQRWCRFHSIHADHHLKRVV